MPAQLECGAFAPRNLSRRLEDRILHLDLVRPHRLVAEGHPALCPFDCTTKQGVSGPELEKSLFDVGQSPVKVVNQSGECEKDICGIIFP